MYRSSITQSNPHAQLKVIYYDYSRAVIKLSGQQVAKNRAQALVRWPMAAGAPMLIVACLLMTSGLKGVSSSILRVDKSYTRPVSRHRWRDRSSQELPTLVTYLDGQALA